MIFWLPCDVWSCGSGYFNFPVDVVLGPAGQPLVSAIGAQGDDGRLRFGMVLYTSEGEFLHGLQEAETGLVRPYGLSYSQEYSH